MIRNGFFKAAIVMAALSVASLAQAQTGPTSNWIVEFGIGWDNSISGNINSSAIGSLNNQTVVILKNKYEDVTAPVSTCIRRWYMLNDGSSQGDVHLGRSTPTSRRWGLRATLLRPDSDYQSLTLDVGLRRYGRLRSNNLRPYAEGSIGLGFVDKTDVELVAPQANLRTDATDFYDQTTAFTFSGNAGVLWNVSPRLGVFAQLGLRWVTGMSEVDNFVGTGLDSINDNSSRWTMPFLVGARLGF